MLPLSFADNASDAQVSVLSSSNGVVVVGSDDGTILIVHDAPSPSTPTAEPKFSRPSRPSSPLAVSIDSRTTSRSISPSSISTTTSPPFSVASRSRIVSGITKEQVEAPKNFVDYDEEPDKLKDMLKGRRSKEKRASIDATLAQPTLDVPPKRRDSNVRSLLSATNSPAFTPISTPGSPASPSRSLEFECCVFPPLHHGQTQIVTAIKHLDDSTFLALYASGYLSVISTDGRCLASTYLGIATPHDSPSPSRRFRQKGVWLWQRLSIVHLEQKTNILVFASQDLENLHSEENDDNQQSSRVGVVEYTPQDTIGATNTVLSKVADWFLTGDLVVSSIDGPPILCYVSWDQHLHLASMHRSAIPLVQPFELHHEQHHTGLAVLSNAFKRDKYQPIDAVSLHEKEPVNASPIALEAFVDSGVLDVPGKIGGIQVRSSGNIRILCWSDSHIAAYEQHDNALATVFVEALDGVEGIEWFSPSSFAVLFECKVQVYDFPTQISVQHPCLIRTLQTGPRQAIYFNSTTTAIFVDYAENDGSLQTVHLSWEDCSGQLQRNCRKLRSFPAPGSRLETQVTSILPLGFDLIVMGYANGYLRTTSLTQLCQPTENKQRTSSDVPLNGAITGLHIVRNDRTTERFVVGGGYDGSIAFWHAETLKICARWVVFVTPIAQVLQFDNTTTGPLRGCVLCVSQDGTIAVVAVDGFQFLYVIPGSAFPLVRVCIGEDNLLLMYADSRARLWDVKTKEFWRSMSVDKTHELIGQGGWSELSIDSQQSLSSGMVRALPAQSLRSASKLLFDLETFITEAVHVMKSISTNMKETRLILSMRGRIQTLLSVLLTFGLNHDIDEICQEDLGIVASLMSVGFASEDFVTTFCTECPADSWRISGEVSASRAMAIVTALRALGLFEELTESTNAVISFYATSLASSVGDRYQTPSLGYLAKQWLGGSHDTRQSARLLFDAAITRLSDEKATSIAEQWQHHLPCLQPTAERCSAHAVLSLFICGYLAAEKYSLFPTSTLTDISKSLQLYLHDQQSTLRILAVDLCSRGFHVWQHYIDAMEILRALFLLATSSKKEAISSQNVGAQARLAVLQIAASNTPLFMTTLGLDILSPSSVEHRKSVMQIVAFLIRKRPMVLYPNLPKLMEAVVKSLDPNSTMHREAVLDTATEIIGHVVKTFPSVDFHMNTQRLAVGTSEGALVMYDLKTAIRLYVLENHKKRIAACSFSPDGRRLVTMSLEESVVLVWKVGSSFSSFFNPGAPPRQGHSGSEPFKTLSFNVGDEGDMLTAESLQLVRFEWTAERSVKLKIRDSVLTFST